MTVIYGTNLVVDDFRILSKYPLQKFIFFLTHMHAGLFRFYLLLKIYVFKIDHYVGMKNNWDYGPIYCSPITKKLLLNKYEVVSEIVIN